LKVSSFAESGKSQVFHLMEGTFAVVALFIFSRAAIFQALPQLSQAEAAGMALSEEAAGVISQPNLLWIYISIYCCTVLLMIGRLREAIYYLWQEKFLLLLMTLTALSSLWSLVPYETLAKTIAMIGCSIFGLYFALRYRPALQMHLLGCTFYFIIIASIAIPLLLPEIGKMRGIHEGLWRGAFTHKNMLGTTAALSAICFFLLAANSPYRTLMRWSGFCFSLFLLLMSCSKSSLLSYCIILMFLAFYAAAHKRYKLVAIALLSVAICAGAFAMQYKSHIYPPILLSNLTTHAKAFLSEDRLSAAADRPSICTATVSKAPRSAGFDTATDRVDLWQLVVREIGQKPVLGYGLGGFWLGLDGPSGAIWKQEKWHPPHSHNGFLDLWLHLGIIGLILFLMSFCVAFYLSFLRLCASEFSPARAFTPAILAYIFVANVAESDLYSTNYILWILFVASVVSVRKYGVRKQEQVSV